MAWTATLKGIRKRDDAKFEVLIAYANGARSCLREYAVAAPDDEAIKTLARNECKALEAIEAKRGALTLSAGAVLDVSDPSPKPADPAEISRMAWFSKVAKLRQQKEFVDLGILAEVDPALLADIKATALPAYTAA